MDPFTMIFGIVGVTCIAGVLRSYFNGKQFAGLQEVEDLKRRIEALEKANR